MITRMRHLIETLADACEQAGMPASEARALLREYDETPVSFADQMTEFKTNAILNSYDYRKAGYILVGEGEGEGVCLSSGGAVRWLTAMEMWLLMQEPARVLFDGKPMHEVKS